jgi:hypothetical protein
VLHGSGARRETRWKAQAIFLVLILNYAAIVVAADAVSGLDAKLAWAIVAVIVIQAIVALGIAFLGMFVGRGFSTGIRNPRST